jgi:hypothetical protein
VPPRRVLLYFRGTPDPAESTITAVIRLAGDRVIWGDLDESQVNTGDFAEIDLAQHTVDSLKRVETRPGEPADKPFVDIGEAGMGEVVAEVVEVGPGPVTADRPPCRLCVGQGLVADRNPQPVQDPPVPGVASKTTGVAFAAQRRDLSQ